MPRRPKPWFKASHRAWYVKIDRKLYRLGDDEREATREFHRIMASRVDSRPSPGRITVVELLDAWLVDREGKVKAITFGTYREVAESFASFAGSRRASEIKPLDVSAWIRAKGWGQATESLCGGLIKQAWKWAHDQGWLDRHTLAGLKLPRMPRRPPPPSEEGERFLASLTGPVRDIAVFIARTGCRPGEARSLESSQVDWAKGTAMVTGKRGTRTVVLPGEVLDLLKTLAEEHPRGPIFRNSLGGGWTERGLNRAIKKAREGGGFSPLWVPYAGRGYFATERVRAGVDSSIVAKLMGHTSLEMFNRHYHNPDEGTLREGVERGRKET